MGSEAAVDSSRRRAICSRSSDAIVASAASSSSSPSSTRSHAICSAAHGVRFAGGLQHPQLAVLDGELEVLRIAEDGLEAAAQRLELVDQPGHRRDDNLGIARHLTTTDDVFPLGVEQEVDVEAVLSGGWGAP